MPTRVCIVKAMVFSLVKYGCESWTIKKADCWRIDGFKLWCWRRLLRVPWTAKRSSQSILKEINLEYSLEGLMLKLNLQYSGHLMQSQLIGKDPDAGKDWRQKEKRAAEGETVGCHVDGCHELGGSILNGCEFEQTLRDSGGQESLACCSPWGHKKKDTTEQQQPESILQSCPRFLIPRAVLSCCFCKKLLYD